jgi:hypothetical protein
MLPDQAFTARGAVWLLMGVVLAVLYMKSLHSQVKRAHDHGLLLVQLVYLALALLQGDVSWVVLEGVGALIWGMLAYFSSKSHGRWWLVMGWALHPVWDMYHLTFGGEVFVPVWYMMACISFD